MPAFFIIVYWTGIVIEIAIRVPYRQAVRTAAKTDQRVTSTEKIILALLLAAMVILPLIYSVTDWLAFADYTLPTWMGWTGVGLMAIALLLFTRAHRDLQTNWSPSLEIYEGHNLITTGIYRFIRHPMYASQWVWVVAQILLLQNWVAGWADLAVFIPFYILRVRAEEKMLLETFGESYRRYREQTGGIIPRF